MHYFLIRIVLLLACVWIPHTTTLYATTVGESSVPKDDPTYVAPASSKDTTTADTTTADTTTADTTTADTTTADTTADDLGEWGSGDFGSDDSWGDFGDMDDTGMGMEIDPEIQSQFQEQMAEADYYSGITDAEQAQIDQDPTSALKLGALTVLEIKNIQTTTTSAGAIQITADATLFGIPATIGCVVGSPLKFTISLTKAFSIPITPWKTISFQTLTLSIADKEVKLYTNISLFNADDVEIGFNLSKKSAHISLASLKTSDIIPILKDSIFDKISLKNISLSIKNIFDPKATHPVSFACTTDFSALKLPLNIKVDNLLTTASVDLNKGITIKAGINTITIGKVAEIQNPNLQIFVPTKTKTPQDAKLTVEATAVTNVPIINKKITAKTTGEVDIGKGHDPKITFTLHVDTPFTFPAGADFLKFGSFDFSFSTDGTVSLKGDSTLLPEVLNLALITQLNITKDQQGKEVITASAEMKEKDKPLNPLLNMGFDDVKIPILKDLVNSFGIQDVKIAIQDDAQGISLILSGQAKAFNIPSVTELRIQSSEKMSLKIGLADDFKFSDVIPVAKIFDVFDLSGTSLIFSTYTFPDSATNQQVNAGINILAGSKINIGLDKIQQIIKDIPTDVSLGSCLGPDPTNISINFQLPTIQFFPLPLVSEIPAVQKLLDNFKCFMPEYLGFCFSVDVELIESKPRIEFGGKITLQPTKNDQKLYFDAKVGGATDAIGQIILTLSASMVGTWDNPFGIPGLSFGDVGLESDWALEWETIEAGIVIPYPTKLGITGKLTLCGHEFDIAAQYSDELDVVLWGAMKGKSLQASDLIQIPLDMIANVEQAAESATKEAAKSVGIKTDGIKLPVSPDDFRKAGDWVEQMFDIIKLNAFKITDPEFYFVPFETKIGDIVFKPGISLKGMVELDLDKPYKAGIDVELGLSGIKAKCFMSEISIGNIIKISGAQETDPGPIFDLTLMPPDLHFYLSGKISLMDGAIEGGGFIDLDILTAKTAFEAKFLDLVDLKFSGGISGSLLDPTNLSFDISAELDIGGATAVLDLELSKYPYVFGKIEKFDLSNILLLVEEIGADITKLIGIDGGSQSTGKSPANTIPNVGFENIQMSLATKATTSPQGDKIPEGFSFQSDAVLFGEHITTHASISRHGFTLGGKIAAFQLGGLKLDDTELDIALTTKDQHLMLKGGFHIKHLVDETISFYIGNNKLSFDAACKLFDTFSSTLHVDSSGSLFKNPQFNVKASLDSSFTDHIVENATDALIAAVEKIVQHEQTFENDPLYLTQGRIDAIERKLYTHEESGQPILHANLIKKGFNAVKKGVEKVVTAGAKLLDKFGGLALKIHSASLEFNLAKLDFKAAIDYEVVGMRHKVNAEIDLKDMKKTFKSITNAMVQAIT